MIYTNLKHHPSMKSLKNLAKALFILIIFLVVSNCQAQSTPIDTIMMGNKAFKMTMDSLGRIDLVDIEQEKAEKLERQRRLERRMQLRRSYDEQEAIGTYQTYYRYDLDSNGFAECITDNPEFLEDNQLTWTTVNIPQKWWDESWIGPVLILKDRYSMNGYVLSEGSIYFHLHSGPVAGPRPAGYPPQVQYRIVGYLDLH